jgi:flagellar L-ring protein precursor FlgH
MKLLTIFLSVFIFACSHQQTVVKDPDFSSVRPVSSSPMPANDGAIYKKGYSMSLFEDVRARHVGDIILVILNESTNASKSASTSTSKDADVEILNPTVWGKGVGDSSFLDKIPASLESSKSFDGEGDSSQSNQLTGTIAVTVTEVLSNGNLMVRGEKILTLNQGSEHIRLSGIIRTVDIGPNNSVSSSQIADAQFIYGGVGVIADANTTGWMQRILQSKWWPF